MYGKSFEVTDRILDKDFVLPIGKAKVEREGTDITLIGFSKLVGMCLKAADALQQEGISCEVINLRTLRPLDRETIIKSVKKTHRCIAVEEGWPQCGITAEISAILMEEAFDWLDAPVERITGADVPMPYAANLEKIALPHTFNVVNTAKRMLRRSS